MLTIWAILLCLPSALFAQWFDVSPTQPVADDFNNSAVFFLNEDTGYMGTALGQIQRTFDGGLNWDIFYLDSMATWPHTTPWPIQITSLYFYNENVGFAGCRDGWIFKTSDGGDSWTELPRPPIFYEDIMDFKFFNEQAGVAISKNDFLRTDDGGISWEANNSIGLNYAFYVYSPEEILVIGEGVRLTADSGNVFSELSPLMTLYDLTSSTPQDLLMSRFVSSGSMHEVWSSDDGGVSWTNVASLDWLITKLDYRSPMTASNPALPEVYALAWRPEIWGNAILVSYDHGSSWDTSFVMALNQFTDLHFPSPNAGYAVGHGGTILKLEIPVSTFLNTPRQALRIYPSPASDFISIETQNPHDFTDLYIRSLDGKLVTSQHLSAGTKQVSIPVNYLPPGLYTVTLKQNGVWVATSKYIKK